MGRARYVGDRHSALFIDPEGSRYPRRWRVYTGYLNGAGNTFIGTVEKVGNGPHAMYRLTIGASIAARETDPMVGVTWDVFGGNVDDAAKQLRDREGAPAPTTEESK